MAPTLPRMVPILYHGSSRGETVSARVVGLSLYRMFDRRSGLSRFNSREGLCAAFGITPGTQLLLTGTAYDPPLERWWRLGEARRPIIRAMRRAGIIFATTPNYSLFTDVPRWDDLHSVKRIALVHSEFLEEGLPTALHVNSRTEHDFSRWKEYVAARPEVTHIAYEFTTGTGWAGRCEQHAEWLIDLARAVARPLHLVVRGGIEVLPALAEAFGGVTFLDTSVFMKTMMRRKAVPIGNSRMGWLLSPTAQGASVHDLLAHNLATVDSSIRRLAAPVSSQCS